MVWLVAVLLAGLQSLIGFTYQRYTWWRGWMSRRVFAAWFSAYVLVSAVLGGTIGWGLALISDARTSGHWALDGVVYGAAGSVVLRASLGTRSREDSSASTLAQSSGDDGRTLSMDGTVSLLGAWLGWIEGALDTQAARGISAFVDSIAVGKHFYNFSRKVNVLILMHGGLPQASVVEWEENARVQLADLKSPIADTRETADLQLRASAKKYVARGQVNRYEVDTQYPSGESPADPA